MSEAAPGRRPTLTLTEAAAACGVSRDTMKRRLRAGAFANAEQDGAGVWRVPVTDLLAAGFHPHGAERPQERPEAVGGADPPPGEVERLRAALSAEQARREQAEAVAAERERTIDLLSVALRALPPASEHQGAAPAHRRWFRRS